ncbi:ABC transporter permease [Deinococcus roseus]|uniref:Peptide ABC transporter permease n=1 Tax=Deinococcus roseus TaxID=392414 RepID=A0ABQ2CVR4_9DEIO|nr:ABC transporter permease [Deinococcus roseus]GGJ25410.1 peptide ABC transporter permease [Deinococcus roseus]
MNIWKKFRKNPLGLIGMLIILAFLVMALFAPVLAPLTEDIRNLPTTFTVPNSMVREGFSALPTPPSKEHVFGLAAGGYDIYWGLIWGVRSAFLVGIGVTLMTALVGILVGITAGYYGGWVDNVFMRFTDIIFAFPNLVLLMILVIVLGRSLPIIMLALVLVGWAQYARVVRGDVLKIKRLEYVDAAKSLGNFDSKVITKHVLPNSLNSLLALVSLDIGSTVVTFAALSFIGVGVPEGFPDWGYLINISKGFFGQINYWYTYIYPATFILLFVLGWTLLGEAIREAIDPRSR